ncbi:hypothetical protein TSUD_344410 [Trifolium subterraneum]|nr:hypothetical protein TSUD_344410 [Trifolium subterraneum]
MSYRPNANARTEVRRNRYKVAVDAEEGRRRREDNLVEIRKNRREESLQKKRREGLQAQQMPESVNSTQVEKKLEHIPALVTGIWTDDNNMQFEATTQFRKLLSIERSPPIEEVIQAGVVPRFIEFLMREDFPQLQFEAAWALTNIASGTSENTKVVIDSGAVPIFVKLLASPSDDVREQAVWALGNVAGDSPRCRDLVLSHGALLPLLAQLNEHAKLSMLRNATWTLSNFCRGKPQPAFDQVKPALPALAQLIHSNDEEVLTDACWALSYLSDGANDKIQGVIDAGVCSRLVELLLHPSPSVLIPALRTVGNIVTGDDMQTQFDIKKEAAWAISNATSGGSHEQLKYLGLEKIENLQSHDNTEIYEKAVKILETYWLEEDDEVMPPGDASQPGFNFGGSEIPAVPSGFLAGPPVKSFSMAVQQFGASSLCRFIVLSFHKVQPW